MQLAIPDDDIYGLVTDYNRGELSLQSLTSGDTVVHIVTREPDYAGISPNVHIFGFGGLGFALSIYYGRVALLRIMQDGTFEEIRTWDIELGGISVKSGCQGYSTCISDTYATTVPPDGKIVVYMVKKMLVKYITVNMADFTAEYNEVMCTSIDSYEIAKVANYDIDACASIILVATRSISSTIRRPGVYIAPIYRSTHYSRGIVRLLGSDHIQYGAPFYPNAIMVKIFTGDDESYHDTKYTTLRYPYVTQQGYVVKSDGHEFTLYRGEKAQCTLVAPDLGDLVGMFDT